MNIKKRVFLNFDQNYMDKLVAISEKVYGNNLKLGTVARILMTEKLDQVIKNNEKLFKKSDVINKKISRNSKKKGTKKTTVSKKTRATLYAPQ